jgi:peptidyl-prolyl cis-trans isomerase D
MMQSLNSGLSGKFLKGLLVLFLFGALAGLVVSDVGGFFRDGGVSRTDVAKVGSETISLQKFVPIVRRAVQQTGLQEDQAIQMGLPYMILQQEINNHLLQQAAEQNGIRISDNYVATELKKKLDKLDIPGSTQEKLQLVLQQQGATEKQLVEEMRYDYAINLLASAIASGKQALPTTMAEAGYLYTRQKRDALIIQVSEANLRKKPDITDALIAGFYDENKEKYRTTEKRDIRFVVIKQKDLLPDVTISDAEIETYYNENADQFINPDRVRLSQLITQDEKSAQKIIDQKPNDLAALKSDKVDYLPSDWYIKSALNTKIQDALFGDKPVSGIIGPIQTELGWHVLQVETYETGKAKPLAEVKDTIRDDLKGRALDETLNDVTDQIESLAAASSDLNDVAKEFKLTTQSATGLTQQNLNSKLDALKLSDAVKTRLQESVFALDELQISPIMDTSDGDMILAQITKRDPSVIPELASIRDQVKQDALESETTKAIEDLANEAIRAYDGKNSNAWLTKVTYLNLRSEGKAALDRPAATKAMGEQAANLLFTLTPSSPVSSIGNDKGVLIVFLKNVIPYQGAMDNGAIEANQKRLTNAYAQEVQQQFINAMRQELGVTINDNLLQQYFKAVK